MEWQCESQLIEFSDFCVHLNGIEILIKNPIPSQVNFSAESSIIQRAVATIYPIRLTRACGERQNQKNVGN